MTMLRATVGFMFFLLAFWLRDQTGGHGLVRRRRRTGGHRHDLRQRDRRRACAARSARSRC